MANVGMFDVVFPDQGPSVSIIIPTKDQLPLLRNCLESLRQTTYKNYKIVVLDNDSERPETLEYLRSIDDADRIRVLRIPSPPEGFSLANLNNVGARQC